MLCQSRRMLRQSRNPLQLPHLDRFRRRQQMISNQPAYLRLSSTLPRAALLYLHRLSIRFPPRHHAEVPVILDKLPAAAHRQHPGRQLLLPTAQLAGIWILLFWMTTTTMKCLHRLPLRPLLLPHRPSQGLDANARETLVRLTQEMVMGKEVQGKGEGTLA